jgi:hypothetical protein
MRWDAQTAQYKFVTLVCADIQDGVASVNGCAVWMARIHNQVLGGTRSDLRFRKSSELRTHDLSWSWLYSYGRQRAVSELVLAVLNVKHASEVIVATDDQRTVHGCDPC